LPLLPWQGPGDNGALPAFEQAAALTGIDGKAGGPEQGTLFTKGKGVTDASDGGFFVRLERGLPLRLLLADALP
jgi:hypothetical protein